MMPTPLSIKVSIILPVYNAGAVLLRALDSALGQTLHDIEVIAVDDGSADDSGKILSERAALDPRLIILQQPVNSGTFSARNRGLRECQGEYVLFLDPDDYLDLNAAEELSALADREKLDVIHFGTREFSRSPDGTMTPRCNWTPPEEKLITGKGQALRFLLLSAGGWSLCFKMIRSDILRKALAETEDFYCTMGEDLYFYLLTAFHADRLQIISRPYYHYDTGSGITVSKIVSPEKFKRSAATVLDALNRSEEFLRRKGILDDADLSAGWNRIVRNQYLILWNRWYSRLAPGTRGEIGEFLLHKAGNKELFLLSVFDENDYLREIEEFLKFSSGIYRFLNYILPQHSFLRMKIKSWYKKMKNRRKERI